MTIYLILYIILATICLVFEIKEHRRNKRLKKIHEKFISNNEGKSIHPNLARGIILEYLMATLEEEIK